MREPNKCYICEKPLEGDNASLEHIVLNGIGGKLRSRTLLCKTCNGELGHKSDVALSESLSFYTDMLQVKKDRDNGHNQVMTDEEGHEIIVEDAGGKLKLRRSYFEKEILDDEKRYHITAKNEKELKDYLEGQVKAKEITQAQMDEVMAKAKMKPHRPRLTIRTVIPQEAFPNIVRSAVNYYIENTRRYDDVKHLIPYIKGERNCQEILHLVLFDILPYEEKGDEITHMIHLEGNPTSRVLYAMLEYYGLYTYAVFLKEDYDGPELNLTYCYDVLHEKETEREFSLPVNRKWIEKYKEGFEATAKERFAAAERRANKILGVWQEKDRDRAVKDIVGKAFSKIPEGAMITPEMLDGIIADLAECMVEVLKDGGE